MAQASIQPVKFLFETAFDNQSADNNAEITPEDVDAIRQEAHAAGFAAAQNETARTINNIETQLANFYNQLETETSSLKDEAITLALLGARKLARTLINRQPIAEIEALILEVLDQMAAPPHIIITVNEEVLEDIKSAIENSSSAALSASKLQFTGVTDIAKTDCAIKWGDGEIIRDTTTIKIMIDAIISSYLPTIQPDTIDQPTFEIPNDDNTQAPTAALEDDAAAQGDPE